MLDSMTTATAGDDRSQRDWSGLAKKIRDWGREVGFDEIGIAGTTLDAEEAHLVAWLAAGRHGTMDYMARHGARRARPAELVPGTLCVVTARLNYLPPDARASEEVLADPAKAFIARYALGRDYHKVLRATRAIVAPYELDARRCISYLTIEHVGSIPEDLRPLMGNRIYGCDDCQLVCPWNRYATTASEAGFAVRHGLDDAGLVALFAWTEREFLDRMAGSAIRRIG